MNGMVDVNINVHCTRERSDKWLLGTLGFCHRENHDTNKKKRKNGNVDKVEWMGCVSNRRRKYDKMEWSRRMSLCWCDE